jgi:hypothetical protein
MNAGPNLPHHGKNENYQPDKSKSKSREWKNEKSKDDNLNRVARLKSAEVRNTKCSRMLRANP